MTSEIRKAFLSENLSEQKDWVVFARNSEAGHSRPEHVHDVAQLLYAESGVMLLVSEGIPRLVPPHQALWIPAGIPHSLTFIRRRGFGRSTSPLNLQNGFPVRSARWKCLISSGI